MLAPGLGGLAAFAPPLGAAFLALLLVSRCRRAGGSTVFGSLRARRSPSRLGGRERLGSGRFVEERALDGVLFGATLLRAPFRLSEYS